MAIASDKTISEKRNWTDEEFMALPDGDRYELVNEQLFIVGNSGMEHGHFSSVVKPSFLASPFLSPKFLPT
ncbi:hypothetical protein AB3R30_05245 [Leptolyngbyaceae cyanobacterium UHCC 1019]